MVFGGTHLQTFDKKWFDFDGECNYVLAKDNVTNLFDIIIGNIACNPAKGKLLLFVRDSDLVLRNFLA